MGGGHFTPLTSEPIGILAGKGDLPKALIKTCLDKNISVFVVAIEKQTPPETIIDVRHIWLKIGQLGTFVRILQKHQIKKIIFAGSIQRPDLNAISLDWEGIKLLGKLGYKALGDDAILTTITRFLEEKGFQILPPSDILQDLIPQKGVLTLKSPTSQDLEDIHKGIKVLNLISSADIGQALVVQMGQILGIEAIEGTQELIKRVGKYKISPQGGVLVKMAKINQNLKIDLPTIGINTIEQIYESNLNGLAIEAINSQIIDRDAVISLANKLGLFIYSCEKDRFADSI